MENAFVIASQRAYAWMYEHYDLQLSSNGWYLFHCPECNKKERKGAFHPRYMRVKCWSCGYDDTLYEFMRLTERLNILQAKLALKACSPRAFDGDDEEVPIKKKIVDRAASFSLPRGFKELVEGTSRNADRARAYLIGRGFDIDLLNQKGFGWCSGVENEFYGYIIVPFKLSGRLVYFIGRDFLGRGEHFRYKNPKLEDCGVGKGDYWYNQDALLLFESIEVVEGWSDAETLGERCIASCGYTWSPQQLLSLGKSKVKDITIIADKGKFKEMLLHAFTLVNTYGKRVRVVNMDKVGKDVNAVGRKVTLLAIKKTKWLTDSDIFILLSTL